MNILINWLNDNQTLFIDYAIKIVVAICIIIVGKIVASLIAKAVSKIMVHRKVDDAVLSFIASMIYCFIFFVAIIAAISHLGFNTSSLVAVVGAAGLAIGLALQGSLSNFASGVLLIVFKPFKAGDYIEAAGVAGIAEEILIFSTKLRTGDNKTVIIPNGSITGSTITNYSAKPTRRIDLIIGVSYEADLVKAKILLSKVVSGNELVLREPETTIGVTELADCSVNFVVRPWVKSENYWPVYFELLETIKIELDNAGIEIPFPQLSIHLNKEENHES